MQRRQLIKSMISLGAGSVLLNMPLNALSKSTNRNSIVNYKELFNKSLASNPNLIGFANIEHNFKPQVLSIEGSIPKDLNGIFYRNGPGKSERGEQRYQHLFEGDGMLQSFSIANGKIIHQGKFIETPKFQKEQQANKFLYSGPDTRIANPLPVSNSDMVNTANTNIIPVGNDLWALWEAGSPTQINPESLEYVNQVSLGENTQYQKSLQGLPFSAHPKIEPNGDIWNFGLNQSGHIVLYHLSNKGMVKNVGIVNSQYQGSMLHDFLMTEKHLLLILPSLKKVPIASSTRQGFFGRITYDKNQPMRVLVVSKKDLTLKQQYELPAGFAFHYGNAWEESNGTIRFDASLYPDVDVLHSLSRTMQGQLNNPHQESKTALFTLTPNGDATQTILETTSEFPKVCDHVVGLRNKFIYHLSSSRNSLWSDTLCSLNVDSGTLDSFDFGKDFLVEEHVSVCPQRKEGTGYLIGTALHVPSKRTCVNIFKADNISQGPVTRAWLSHHLPLGFHGNFKLS